MIPESQLIKLLTGEFGLSKKDITAYTKKAINKRKTLEQFVVDEGIVEEEDVYGALAKEFEVPFMALKGKEIKKDILNMIPAPLAQTHHVVAFDANKKTVSIAMLDPGDLQTIEFIERKTGLVATVYITAPGDISDALRRYHADLESDISISQISDNGEDVGAGELQKAAEELPIVNIVNSILEHAVYEGASDIHIEPAEAEVVVRYRVDGVLKGVMNLPKKVQQGIIARIKILSNLKIDEHMIPQDGRFKIQISDEKLAFRVSILPVYEGEKIVMRILHEGQKPLSLDQLGFLPGPRAIVEEAIEKPHGMILVTGPTGSGKTTTLYSVLGILNKPEVNISTIEDPIEYHVGGINQSQINTRVGFTFAAGLRSFLRQDPDIIMVGEIRDAETGEIAIHAAMTGHLVLSTLHTNDAPTTLPRLLDMDIPPFLVAFTANIIIAQRLVRKVCEHCKKEYTLDKDELKELASVFDMKRMKDLFADHDIKLKTGESHLEKMTFYRGEGCRRCGKTGYKGRVGIYEVLDITKDLTSMINKRATAEEIKSYARDKQKMITMLQDGLIKAKQGITTIEEILRVTRD